MDAQSGAEDEGERPQPEDLPFAVTVGTAEAYAGGYVVPAIDARQGGSHAVLAVLDREVSRGSVLDLGRVYGDAEPPRVIVRDDEGFVVVPDTDASGNAYRYGWVRGLNANPRVDWLGTFAQTVDDSPVYALARTADTIAVAWDELERQSRQSHVRWALLDKTGRPIAITQAAPSPSKGSREPTWSVNSTGRDVDAEAPQLVAHASGYWLAFLASEPEHPAQKKPIGGAEGAVPRPKATANDEDMRVVDLGRRGVWLMPLDVRGLKKGNPIVVTSRTAHVVTYDIEATGDGGAIVAYRDADASPGVEEQVIEVVRVRADGGLERFRIDDERVGAGTPAVLLDRDADTASFDSRSAWLAVAGSAGETRVAELRAFGPPLLEIVEEPNLIGVEPMLRRGDSLLVARHRARFVEFERMDCVWPDGQKAAPKTP